MCRGDPLAIARFRKVARDPPSSSVESPPIANALNRRTARAWSSQGRSVPDCRPSRGYRSRSRNVISLASSIEYESHETVLYTSPVSSPQRARHGPAYTLAIFPEFERSASGCVRAHACSCHIERSYTSYCARHSPRKQ